jgi:hypothetical protein
MEWLTRQGPELLGFALFLALAAASLILPLISPALGSTKYAPAFNAALSIGTGGLVSFAFYYLVNQRLEHRRRKLLRDSLRRTYHNAKHDIVLAVILASRKGGRSDLVANSETINKALTISGFRSLFAAGHEADEGFYAFENQMSDKTYEFDEIVFNLKTIARAASRLIDVSPGDDPRTYNFFIRLDIVVERILRNGPGYDESKLLCSFVWEILAGQNPLDGDLGYDPIERAIERL